MIVEGIVVEEASPATAQDLSTVLEAVETPIRSGVSTL